MASERRSLNMTVKTGIEPEASHGVPPDPRSRLLVDSFGLGKFRPAPRFALALFRYVARPTPRSYAGLMNHCAVDFAAVRAGLGERWDAFESYTLDRARSAEGKAALRVMMRELAVPAIPAG